MFTGRPLYLKVLSKVIKHGRSVTRDEKRCVSFCAKQWSRCSLQQSLIRQASVCQGHPSLLRKHINTESTKRASEPSSLLSLSPTEFVDFLKKNNIKRGFVAAAEAGAPWVSHPELQPLADSLLSEQGLRYENHEAIFFTYGQRSGCLLAAFIWKTNRGQAVSLEEEWLKALNANRVDPDILAPIVAGGIDFRSIGDMREFLTDGNTLSKTMGIKAALAANWAGGGKGLIALPSQMKQLDPTFRQNVFYDFGDFLTSLNGCIVAGSGIGTFVTDINNLYTRTRYCSNLTENIGGTGNTAYITGIGVAMAMEAAIEFLQLGTLEGKTVAVQGAGLVGVVIIDQLLKRGVRHIHVAECNQLRADDVKDMFHQRHNGRLKISKVEFEDTEFFQQECDIFAPCAWGKVLNKHTIPLLRTKIVCGSAHSPADTVQDRQMLFDKKITYIGDVIQNRMGIVSKLTEQWGRLQSDPEIIKHLDKEWEYSIYQTTLRALRKATQEGITPEQAAYQLGEEMSEELHPLFPGRSRNIIRSLVEANWHKGEDYWKSANSFGEGSDMV